jgi:mannose-1-phosphate guanylyltransferase
VSLWFKTLFRKEQFMYAVIMAGGSGTRFWPASREHLPKQFLPITSGRTMLEETLDRVIPLFGEEAVYVVVNQLHADLARQLIGDRRVELLVEPVGRNTAACVGLAALHIRKRDEDAPVVVLPSDHYVANVENFLQLIKAAAEVARSGSIVTLGIEPTRPETGYGYIKIGKAEGQVLNNSYYQVERFVEKPDNETARSYLMSGGYLWNSGIFALTARTALSEIETCMPSLSGGLREIEESIGKPNYSDVVNDAYEGFESVSIDYGVLEKTKIPVYVFPAGFGWSDVGSWQALYELRSQDLDEQKNLFLGEALAIQSRGNLVFSNTDRLVALLGVEGLVVVDTGDVLLIAPLDRSQEVKQFPLILKKNHKDTKTQRF